MKWFFLQLGKALGGCGSSPTINLLLLLAGGAPPQLGGERCLDVPLMAEAGGGAGDYMGQGIDH